MKYIEKTLFSFLVLISIPLISYSQNNTTNKTIRVFIDCNRCDRSYIRDEIGFVNYVRNKEDAQVHLLITRQRTGSGGTEYTLRYIGRKRFTNRNDILKYDSPKSDTQDEERVGLVETIKVGLIPYLTQTKVINDLDINYEASEEIQSSSESDKWNYWVFEIEGRSFFNGEETNSELFLSGGISADRVTQDWKINMGYDYDYNRQTFSSLDSLGNENTDVFISRGQRLEGRVIKSVSNHWSAGLFTESNSSTRNNIALEIYGGPALEYNIFPYEEYSEREISFMFIMATGYSNYEEITIYNKRSDFLIRPELRSRMTFTQPWGEVEGRVNASAYMHDITKNRVDLNMELDLRIFRGLSLSISGRYSLINDQLSIPKGEITDAEQLLNLRQQGTSYSYRGSVGIEYSFGSIYNNIVNPRF